MIHNYYDISFAQLKRHHLIFFMCKPHYEGRGGFCQAPEGIFLYKNDQKSKFFPKKVDLWSFLRYNSDGENQNMANATAAAVAEGRILGK